MNSCAPPPFPAECPACEGTGTVARRQAVPGSHYAPPEHDAEQCGTCRGAGVVPARCALCADQFAVRRLANGRAACGLCAAESEVNRALLEVVGAALVCLPSAREEVRRLLDAMPRIDARLAKTRGVAPEAANDVIDVEAVAR